MGVQQGWHWKVHVQRGLGVHGGSGLGPGGDPVWCVPMHPHRTLPNTNTMTGRQIRVKTLLGVQGVARRQEILPVRKLVRVTWSFFSSCENINR